MIWKHRDRRTHTQFLSWLFRPLFENRRIRAIIGANLAASIVIVHSLPPIGGTLPAEPVEIAVLSAQDVQVITEKTFRFPLDEFRGFSQGFHQLHPGVDMRTTLGSVIHPAADGMVSQVDIGRIGYGHKVIVKNDNGFTTLYAHMDKVTVKEGDVVTKDTVLGTVGLTGWTTGPHLHFEVHTNSGGVNPKQVLPEMEEKKTKS